MSEAQRCEMQRWEALDLLGSAIVGRVCIVDHGCPIALPMNFRVASFAGDFRIVLRAARGTAIGGYVGPASLEVDQIHLERGSAWSVLVRGALGPATTRDALPDPRPLVPGRHEWLLLEPVAISGRRFTFDASQDGFFVDWGIAPG